jgi:hypothetical protein
VRTIILILTLVSCRDKDTYELDSFLSARCRLLVEPECIESQAGSCGNVISYESQEDCEEAERDVVGDCADDASAALAELDELDQCVDELATFDCLTHAVCTEGLPVYNAGSCFVVNSTIQENCP